MFSKKFVSSFIRDSIGARPMSVVRLFDPLREVKVLPAGEPNFLKDEALLSPYETYSVININPYTLEEQLIIYPVVVVHQTPGRPAPVVIDIE
jgi:hypothetical protein